MAQLSLTEAQRILLGIITSVESGVTTPEAAVEELSGLKTRAAAENLPFKADYTLADFEKIRQNYVSTYDSSTPYVDVETSYAPEPSFESSESY
jgi:hypothetical protein